MTRTEKKAYLQGYIELKHLLDMECEAAGYWHDKAFSISATRMDITGVRSHSRFCPLDKFLEKAEEIAILSDETDLKRIEIQSVIDTVDNKTLHKVLEYRYILDKSFVEIATSMKLSVKYIFNIHLKALDFLDI